MFPRFPAFPILLALFPVLSLACTGSGAVNPLTPANASKPESASLEESRTLYWAKMTLPFDLKDTLNDVVLLSPKEGWACGNNGTVLRYEDGAWKKADPGLAKNENLLAAAFQDKNQGWMVGSHGTILSVRNGAFSLETSPSRETLHDVVVTPSRTIWVVGANGTILTYNGVTWGKVDALVEPPGSSTVPVSEDLHGIAFSDENNGWAVGARGRILRYDGQKWRAVETSAVTTENLLSVAAPSDVQAWAVGAYGAIVRFNGTTWNKIGSASSSDLHRVLMKSEDEGWAAGQDGTILYYDGARWIPHAKLTSKPSLNAIALEKEIGFMVGQAGAFLKFNAKGISGEFELKAVGSVKAAPAPGQDPALWEVNYLLQNQGPKASPFLSFELPLPKGFRGWEPKEPEATPTVVPAAPSAFPSPAASPGAMARPSPAAGPVTTLVTAVWKQKGDRLVCDLGTLAPSETKSLTLHLREEKGNKKDDETVLQAELRSEGKTILEAAPLVLAGPGTTPTPMPSEKP